MARWFGPDLCGAETKAGKPCRVRGTAGYGGRCYRHVVLPGMTDTALARLREIADPDGRVTLWSSPEALPWAVFGEPLGWTVQESFQTLWTLDLSGLAVASFVEGPDGELGVVYTLTEADQ